MRENRFLLFLNHLRLPYSIPKSFALLLSFHSARHTFATLMIQEQQMGIFELSKCLGHKTLEMTKRYVKYDLAATINSAKEVDIFG